MNRILTLILAAAIALLASPAFLSAQNIVVNHASYADDGIVWDYNPTGSSQSYGITLSTGTQCTGTVAAYDRAGCGAAGMLWGQVSGSGLTGYVTIGGVNYYGSYATNYASFYHPTGYDVGLALSNLAPITDTSILIVVYFGLVPVASSSFTLPAYSVMSGFLNQFPSLGSFDFQAAAYYITITSSNMNIGIMAAGCDAYYSCYQIF